MNSREIELCILRENNGLGMASESWTVDQFLADAPPSTAPGVQERITQFVLSHVGADGRLARPLAVVTSGGTQVPLERNCVRFIDNFSKGNRGALSAEQFLENGYAVIFLSRKGSAQPFVSDFQEDLGVQTLTDFFKLDGPRQLAVNQGVEMNLVKAVQRANEVTAAGTYLNVPFSTLFEYLELLHMIARVVADRGPQVLFYLAAAVADFFLPWSEMAEHKIQSAKGDLNLQLRKVPKMLGTLRHDWCPVAMVVSFKLETDDALLISKAYGAIKQYGVHLVVGNMLHTRKDKVYLVTDKDGEPAVEDISRPAYEPVIERPLVAHVVAAHQRHIAAALAAAAGASATAAEAATVAAAEATE